MALVTLAQLKAYVDVSNTSDDSLLTSALSSAEAAVKAFTRRIFEPVTMTRTYSSDAVRGNLLFLDEDLISATSITANGRNVPLSNVVLEPRNAACYSMIRMKQTVGDWLTDDDSEISVVGSWGYGASVPNDIVQAVTRLAAWLYRQKDTHADVPQPTMGNSGVMVMPSGLPKDITQLLRPHQKGDR